MGLQIAAFAENDEGRFAGSANTPLSISPINQSVRPEGK
jgi:hypothetical protein